MSRKITFAVVAVAALGTAALAPTSASAWAWNGGWGFYDAWWGPGYYYSPSVTFGDSIAYCARRYRTYDPASGTFLGRDGFRHFCL
jgi:hypothetical protein